MKSFKSWFQIFQRKCSTPEITPAMMFAAYKQNQLGIRSADNQSIYCPACNILVKPSDPRVALHTAWDSHRNSLEHQQNLKIFSEAYPREA